MRRLKKGVGILLLMACVAAASAALFGLCYRYDNKYISPGPQPSAGTFAFDAQTQQAHAAVFLIEGWEIYRDCLLEPQDFALASPAPDEIVFIGQYGGFEGGDPARKPHGCATYRLVISIPAEPKSYALELPEIFSAYKLYINGVLAEQFGDPASQTYRPETGISSASFLARNHIEIIVAVADHSHLYSGMVYPPAFGSAKAVASLLQARVALRTAVCSVAAALALFFLLTGLLMGKSRSMLLFGLLCLCFVGYTCYPVLKSILRGDMAWYGFENLCFCAMLLIVMALARQISGGKTRLSAAALAFGAFVCVCSVLQTVLSPSDLRLLAAYSGLIGAYKWAVAAFLTIVMLRMAGKGTAYGKTLLAGILVFDCALVMDRILPQHEPILLGWFVETAGFVLVASLGIAMAQELLRLYREKLQAEGKLAGIETLAAMQRAYYPLLLKNVDEARRARHDLRHHLGVIGGFASSGDIPALVGYLERYTAGFSNLVPLIFSENHVVDVMLRNFVAPAAQEGIAFAAEAQVPEMPQIDDADLCIVIGNLLENALEACVRATGERKIFFAAKCVHSQLVLLVDNSFDGHIRVWEGKYLSRKRQDREGLGLASVRAIAEKYGGSALFYPDAQKHLFHSEVMLTIRAPGPPSGT